MIGESEFLHQLRALLGQPVADLDESEKLGRAAHLVGELATAGEQGVVPDCRWVPFVRGRRPTDEADHPGLGSSDHVALLLPSDDRASNVAYLLFRVEPWAGMSESERERHEVSLSFSFAGPRGEQRCRPLPAWSGRALPLRRLGRAAGGAIGVSAAQADGARDASFVVELCPEDVFLPGREWDWSEVDPQIAEAATDAEDPFSFGSLFTQQVRAELTLLRDGRPIAASEMSFDVCDARRFGSLYQRVLERVVQPDTANQAAEAGLEELDPAHHPWFPVLLIGSDKAELYTRALVGDIVHKHRHLTDPRWLLRVGIYLEFLTCLGIFEAVREDLGDLLTPDERRIFETASWFGPLRDALDVEAWRETWKLRRIVTPRPGSPRAGQVSMLNLLAKKKTTLSFLETHHEDLKSAIRLAGPNDQNAQETWHRVFRDAERAVLRKTPDAFPELGALPEKARELVLWHQRGRLSRLRFPGSLSAWFGDQDGLYASACNQYRASMNYVADWAKEGGLMDHTGVECIPEGVSLLRAFMDDRQVHLGHLQRRDGYEGTLQIAAAAPLEHRASLESIEELLRGVALFEALTHEEVQRIASAVRPITLGPFERILVQGKPGTSLFVVADGTLDVLVRQPDGTDLPVATLEHGAVVGEMSVLTGEVRRATVRSVEPAVVYEVGQGELAAILKDRPAAIDELAALMQARVQANEDASRHHGTRPGGVSLRRRIRSFLLGG